jgi:hypothetical protein
VTRAAVFFAMYQGAIQGLRQVADPVPSPGSISGCDCTGMRKGRE